MVRAKRWVLRSFLKMRIDKESLMCVEIFFYSLGPAMENALSPVPLVMIAVYKQDFSDENLSLKEVQPSGEVGCVVL